MITTQKEFSDDWAFDINRKPITLGEARNVECINSNIERILTTSYGERLFNPGFGCILAGLPFENVSISSGEKILDDVIASITRWEPRAQVISSACRLIIHKNESAISLQIVYRIKKLGISGIFNKKVFL